MRFRRFSFVAGWAAVALLAVAGFAAFGNPRPTSQQTLAAASSASMGHTSGAFAGLAFALFGDVPTDEATDLEVAEGVADPDQNSIQSTIDANTEAAASSDTDGSAGTIASDASGWLSEVEVRALISTYFKPEDVNKAVRIAWCESRFDPNSVNLRTGGVGLFQHLPKYWDERATNAGFRGMEPTNPDASTAAAAWEVYNGGGWDVFTCRG